VVAPDLLDAARAVLPNARIVALYGTSEAEPIAAVTADDVVARRAELRRHGGLFIGHEVPDVDIRIVRAIDGPLTVATGGQLEDWDVVDGAAGELLVAGDHVHLDYWHDPEAVRTSKVVDEDGRTWHRTGDMARRDEQGGLWLLGPRGEGRTIAGTKTWSLELETPVTDLVEVGRAAVCMPRFDGANREFKNATAVLAIERAEGFTRGDATQAAVRCLEQRGFDVAIEVRALKQIPLDRRDPTRIDVEALHRKLKPQANDDY
ncbi:MAG: putative ligase, partial [Thermoleophilia bacterium]|nr:putative ligase [Thermoleophilia bacterium]